MKRIAILLMSLLMTAGLLTACADKNNRTDNVSEPQQINIQSLKGPTSMGLVKLYEDYDKCNETIVAAADSITASLLKGETDIATLPCNVAATLYNKSQGKIKIAAINTLGVLQILSKGDAVSSLEDLKGKTIYTTGQGTTPEYILKSILFNNGIDPDKDVTIDFSSEATEVLSKVSTIDNAILMLPEPFATVAITSDENIKRCIDLNDQWKIINGDHPIVTGVCVVRTDFAQSYPELVNEFLTEYEKSIDYVNSNPKEASELIEKYDITKAAIAASALDGCNIHYYDGDDMAEMVMSYLEELSNYNMDSIGGSLPDENIFYKK